MAVFLEKYTKCIIFVKITVACLHEIKSTGGGSAARQQRVTCLHKKAIGATAADLSAHALHAVHDLLLVADERDAERSQLVHR